MIKKEFYIIIFFIVNMVSGNASDADSLLNQANMQYQESHFEEAIAMYERLINDDYTSPGLYFNLGNAYFKSNKLPQAILNYERALLRAPNDEEIQYNLQLARTYVVDEIEEIPPFFLNKWIKSVSFIYSFEMWAMISIISFIIFLTVLLMYLFSGKIGVKKTSFWISILAFIISASSFYFSHKRYHSIYSNKYAIIATPTVTVKGSPDDGGTDLFVLHEGTKVSVKDKLGEWREIKIADGNSGWILQKDILKL